LFEVDPIQEASYCFFNAFRQHAGHLLRWLSSVSSAPWWVVFIFSKSSLPESWGCITDQVSLSTSVIAPQGERDVFFPLPDLFGEEDFSFFGLNAVVALI